MGSSIPKCLQLVTPNKHKDTYHIVSPTTRYHDLATAELHTTVYFYIHNVVLQSMKYGSTNKKVRSAKNSLKVYHRETTWKCTSRAPTRCLLGPVVVPFTQPVQVVPSVVWGGAGSIQFRHEHTIPCPFPSKYLESAHTQAGHPLIAFIRWCGEHIRRPPIRHSATTTCSGFSKRSAIPVASEQSSLLLASVGGAYYEISAHSRELSLQVARSNPSLRNFSLLRLECPE